MYLFIKLYPFFLFLLFLSGCSSQSKIENFEITEHSPENQYSYKNNLKNRGEVNLFVSFSGGGTRASAFSYGVLEVLRDTMISTATGRNSLLSEVDVITAVSGGSFTAAYYGLYGDKIFDDYEEVFLKRNIQHVLISGILNPLNWMKFIGSGFNRSELAVNYYDKHIFDGKTFADFRSDMPFVQINATDLSAGQPFIFRQEYFDFLCSDLSQFPVSRAVAASSAVPVAFAPIVLKNYHGCHESESAGDAIKTHYQDNTRTEQIKSGLFRYIEKDLVDYVHLVDGGVSDNLGVRVLYDTANILSNIPEISDEAASNPPKYLVLLIVNAAVSPVKRMDKDPKEPAIFEQLSAASAAQINRYNIETIQLIKDSLQAWASKLSKTADYEVKPFFIQIDFNGIQDKKRNRLLHTISTSLALPAEQVVELRSVARILLNKSPEFQRLITELNAPSNTPILNDY
ncbi:patatin-like phospholipase family protein [sulfur-oxidizing endosymbiont of Gigantopelta aegis]|uniref:patatin-like phospholipase family protein n=1 Tax=sulfur-oxidizing endosymbiont of Gigantopelta aegis TaxID=2794934 RepID=UPI0018DCCCA1|nr:patatin-like phospholipase family protein [sulfur-oxidizing endosymbiont of Gigantopelta aegis]